MIKKTLYNISFILTIFGSVAWGCIGIGAFIGKQINIIQRLSFYNIFIEYVFYLIIGCSALVFVFLSKSDNT